MIHEGKCISATCDGCQEVYQNDHSGFSLYTSDESLIDDMEGDSWFISHDGSDKHYCPNCHIINDDDKLILKGKAAEK